MLIYAAAGLALCLNSLARSIYFAITSLKAAKTLHTSILSSVLRSPMLFFDTTPIGRVVNRFSTDFDRVDHQITRLVEAFGGCVFFVLGTIVALCIIYPYFIIPVFGVGILYHNIQSYFIKSSVELQRIESVSKSPIFSHFGEVFSGASSIRAYGTNYLQRVVLKTKFLLDTNHRNVIIREACQCWLGIRLEFISTVLIMFCGVFAVISRNSINPGLVGLSLVYGI